MTRSWLSLPTPEARHQRETKSSGDKFEQRPFQTVTQLRLQGLNPMLKPYEMCDKKSLLVRVVSHTHTVFERGLNLLDSETQSSPLRRLSSPADIGTGLCRNSLARIRSRP